MCWWRHFLMDFRFFFMKSTCTTIARIKNVSRLKCHKEAGKKKRISKNFRRYSQSLIIPGSAWLVDWSKLHWSHYSGHGNRFKSSSMVIFFVFLLHLSVLVNQLSVFSIDWLIILMENSKLGMNHFGQIRLILPCIHDGAPSISLINQPIKHHTVWSSYHWSAVIVSFSLQKQIT